MVLRPRNGLSLCAGGGGLDMGLMLAEPGFHTRCWVEWEEYPRSVIVAAQRAGYFAPAPIWDDLTTFDARPFAGCIDTLLAGYPCQPFSHAGQRKGTDDERHLWPDVARVARELGPSLEWLLLENVAGHVSLGLETVLRDLRDMDFTPAVGLFTAAETGAPHERLRVFIVAHRAIQRLSERRQFEQPPSSKKSGAGVVAELERCGRKLEHATCLDGQIYARSRREGGRTADAGGTGGTMADTSRGRHGGSRQGEVEQPGRAEAERSSCNLADTGCAELEGQQPGQRDPCGWQEPHGYSTLRGGTGLFPPGPADMGRWADVLVTSPDLAPSASFGDLASFAGQVAAMAQAGLVAEAEIEPALRRMADGLALRSRALRLLGNGVHPLAAGHAWRTLSAAHGLRPLDLVAAEGGHSNRANVISMIEAAE